MVDPYQILGVAPGASEEEIKKVYKKLALEWHPDRHGGDSKAEEKFKEINAAYQIIIGKDKHNSTDPFFHPEMSDQQLFDFLRSSTFVHRAQVHLLIQITLEEVCSGGQKTIHFSKQKKCDTCAGIGREVLTNDCTACAGAGRTVVTSGIFNISTACQTCGGLGKKLGEVCKICHGNRIIVTQHETIVNLPPGIGDGEAFNTTDGLHITVRHMPHPLFATISGTLNVENEIETSLFDLLLGGDATVRTLIGEMRVKIEPGLRPGSRLRIRGAGILDRQGNRGDHVVRIWAKMPKLSEDHQQILGKLRTELEGKTDVSEHA
jgi:molecular chaperone DnaJ